MPANTPRRLLAEVVFPLERLFVGAAPEPPEGPRHERRCSEPDGLLHRAAARLPLTAHDKHTIVAKGERRFRSVLWFPSCLDQDQREGNNHSCSSTTCSCCVVEYVSKISIGVKKKKKIKKHSNSKNIQCSGDCIFFRARDCIVTDQAAIWMSLLQ